MNDFFEENLNRAVRKFPGVKKCLLGARLRHIRWPAAARAKVCEVTVNSACNNRCLFCYGEPGSFGPGGSEPALREIFEALYAGREAGCWIAAVIGGEPTLRRDIGQVAAFARKAGYACVKLCTNGARLEDPAYCGELVGAGFNMFDISLHGHTAALHDRLVGVPGAFSRAIRAVRNLKALGCEVGTNQVINALNYRHFPEFFRFAYEDLGINYYNIIYGHFRGVMAVNSGVLKVRMSDAVPYIRKGLAPLETAGAPVFSRMLVNFAPCLLPGYLNVLADWESDAAGGDPLLKADGGVVNMAEMKNGQSAKPKSCARCALRGTCRGVDAEYARFFGDSEFVPLSRTPSDFALRTLFTEPPRAGKKAGRKKAGRA